MKLSLSIVAVVALQVVIGIPVPADNPCAGINYIGDLMGRTVMPKVARLLFSGVPTCHFL